MLDTVKTIGVTELHGAYDELRQSPPEGYRFVEMERLGSQVPFLHSPIKGYFDKFKDSNVDIVESVISPVYTKKPWFFSLAVFQEALAFNFFKLPTPKFVRLALIKHLIAKENCKGLLFWSYAGLETAKSYGGVQAPQLLSKMKVVYPAVRQFSHIEMNRGKEKIKLLFSGDFFRKGGMNVIDTFTELYKEYPQIELIVCCSEAIDFNGVEEGLRVAYIKTLKSHPGIQFIGRIPRGRLLEEIMPTVDVYLLPTYNEAFGFAVLEAMAFGIPVITTNIMAMPELVKNNETGLLIDVSAYDMDALFKGYVANNLPKSLKQTISNQLSEKLVQLIESKSLRQQMVDASIVRVEEEFSVAARNNRMKRIYDEAIGIN